MTAKTKHQGDVPHPADPEAKELYFDEKGRFKKGNPGGPGYPRGVPNRFSREVRHAFLEAFHAQKMGGVEGLVEWATKNDDNRTKFYELLCRMLPRKLEVSGPDGGALEVRTAGAMERFFAALAQYAERRNIDDARTVKPKEQE